jgi:hypothetical protein
LIAAAVIVGAVCVFNATSARGIAPMYRSGIKNGFADRKNEKHRALPQCSY